jgi:hypothetical protein
MPSKIVNDFDAGVRVSLMHPPKSHCLTKYVLELCRWPVLAREVSGQTK